MAPVSRPSFVWKLRTRSLPLGARTLLVGILNVTPDSFSDGGQFFRPDHSPDRALAHAHRLLDEGADILDIGGESTRPGSRPAVSAQQEMDRVLPILEALRRERPQAILSIDTYKTQTAEAALQAGAEIVNDVSGFLWDPEMAATCARSGCGVILMHTRGRMEHWSTQPPIPPHEILPLLTQQLAERVQVALASGLAPASVVLDPGLGFGKVGDENYSVLAQLDQLHVLGFPLLVGASRKSFLTRTVSPDCSQDAPSRAAAAPPDFPRHATLAAHTAAILAGAHLIRVHDVAASREAAVIADAICAAVREER